MGRGLDFNAAAAEAEIGLAPQTAGPDMLSSAAALDKAGIATEDVASWLETRILVEGIESGYRAEATVQPFVAFILVSATLLLGILLAVTGIGWLQVLGRGCFGVLPWFPMT